MSSSLSRFPSTVLSEPKSMSIGPQGYAHANYAAALREFGRPRELRASGGWVLEREIPDSDHTDLMGCYPIFSCGDWSGLATDLEEFEELASRDEPGAPVSLSMVLDPFGGCEPDELARMFPDLCRPFKQHFLVDLERDPEEFVASTHKRNVRKAQKELEVDVVEQPADLADAWHELYANLIARHEITGISAFSRESFAAQLDTPGLTMFRARQGDETVGMVLWYAQGSRAYYHLAAYTEKGYDLRASFAIFWTAIETFARDLRWLSLGASAGLDGEALDGLSRFKKGWSTDTRTAFLCGRIFQRPIYDRLSLDRSATDSPYFPAYRTGEFS
jgi:Acetyltransferase (GNAT) domain